MSSFDLTEFKVIAAMDIAAAAKSGAKSVTLRPGAVITPSARDAAASAGIELSTSTARPSSASSPASPAAPTNPKWEALLNSPEAKKIKDEICAVGKKLWHRSYVDGNGGNISYRLTDEAVLCTPTLVSKSDLKPEDMSLVDLDGKQLAGGRPRTQRNPVASRDLLMSVPGSQRCRTLPSAATRRHMPSRDAFRRPVSFQSSRSLWAALRYRPTRPREPRSSRRR